MAACGSALVSAIEPAITQTHTNTLQNTTHTPRFIASAVSLPPDDVLGGALKLRAKITHRWAP